MADSSIAAVHHAGHPDVTKRDFLKLVTGASAAIGTAAVAWAFIDYMNPAKDVLALSSVEVDLTPIVEGQGITVLWQGKPIFLRHRTAKEIKEAEDVQMSQLIEPQPDSSA
jgi:ubiquinol-cytochrome c reductase iron-sulfur subunit